MRNSGLRKRQVEVYWGKEDGGMSGALLHWIQGLHVGLFSLAHRLIFYAGLLMWENGMNVLFL